jgi:uncharacterized protein (TIGR00375 family)
MQKIVADLHFHSKFSRATSKEMVLERLWEWAGYKGVNLLGTADFTHPFWYSELKKNLEEIDDTGLYKLKSKTDILPAGRQEVKFVLSTEISCIYTDLGKVRRIHLIILMPSLESVARFNDRLSSIGNIYSDGRPIMGLSAYDLTKIVLDIDKRGEIILAHAWTPWFSIFGSKSGYDSIKECFRDYTSQILAVETGLSSDPPMNWRVKELDDFALISNGDSHSLNNIMREANVFKIPDKASLSYDLLVKMLRQASPKAREQGIDESQPHLAYTIEFYPEEGKYHWSGHRNCNYKTDHQNQKVLRPTGAGDQTQICPICKRPITLGVMYRVNQLADRPRGGKPRNPVPYKSLVQLTQIIAESLGVGENTQTVQREYQGLIQEFGSELKILEEVSPADLTGKVEEKIIQGIEKVRKGEIDIDPGYDGEFGKVKVFGEEPGKKPAQASLF